MPPSVAVQETSGDLLTSGHTDNLFFSSPNGRSRILFSGQDEIGMGGTVYRHVTIFDFLGLGHDLDWDSPMSFGDPHSSQPWAHHSDKVAVPLIGRGANGRWLHGVGIMSATTGRAVAAIDSLYAESLAWSPTADDLLIVSEDRIMVLDEQGDQRTAEVPDLSRFAYAAWTPDGSHSCCEVGTPGNRRIAFFDVGSLKRMEECPLDPLSVLPLDLSQFLSLGGGQDIDWDPQGLIANAKWAAEVVVGCWIGRSVEPSSSELLLSVLRPQLDALGNYALTFSQPAGTPICHLDELWVQVSIES